MIGQAHYSWFFSDLSSFFSGTSTYLSINCFVSECLKPNLSPQLSLSPSFSYFIPYHAPYYSFSVNGDWFHRCTSPEFDSNLHCLHLGDVMRSAFWIISKLRQEGAPRFVELQSVMGGKSCSLFAVMVVLARRKSLDGVSTQWKEANPFLYGPTQFYSPSFLEYLVKESFNLTLPC